MSPHSPSRKPRRPKVPQTADAGPLLDLNRYVPAFVTFIANKLSNSATVFYQRNFGVNVTDSRICHVIGFNKGPVSRTLATMQKRGLVTIRTAPDDGRSHSISLTARGRA